MDTPGAHMSPAESHLKLSITHHMDCLLAARQDQKQRPESPEPGVSYDTHTHSDSACLFFSLLLILPVCSLLSVFARLFVVAISFLLLLYLSAFASLCLCVLLL